MVHVLNSQMSAVSANSFLFLRRLFVFTSAKQVWELRYGSFCKETTIEMKVDTRRLSVCVICG